MKRSFLAVGMLVLLMGVAPAHAQFTLLPEAQEGADCDEVLNNFEIGDGKIPSPKSIAQTKADQAQSNYVEYLSTLDTAPGSDFGDCVNNPGNAQDPKCNELKQASDDAQAAADSASDEDLRAELLGCAITTGRISLQMIPFFITYMANFLLAMSGIVSVLFIVVGGYFYIYGGLVDQKERGKKYLVNALVGLSLATISWSLVTFIINAITS